jgi:hypothetical protein
VSRRHLFALLPPADTAFTGIAGCRSVSTRRAVRQVARNFLLNGALRSIERAPPRVLNESTRVPVPTFPGWNVELWDDTRALDVHVEKRSL